MCCFIGNDLITGFTVDGHCNLITHGARRQENRCFLTKQFGNFLAQSIDTGVAPLLLIVSSAIAIHRPCRRHLAEPAGDAVGATLLSSKAPVCVAPAMDTEMWEHPATQANVKILKGYGYTILGPVKGELASGRTGMGRLMEPADIVKKVLA